jgi:hypothetical protein
MTAQLERIATLQEGLRVRNLNIRDADLAASNLSRLSVDVVNLPDAVLRGAAFGHAGLSDETPPEAKRPR